MHPASSPPFPLDVAKVDRLIDEHFPGIHVGGRTVVIEAVADRMARVRPLLTERNIRPGGTI